MTPQFRQGLTIDRLNLRIQPLDRHGYNLRKAWRRYIATARFPRSPERQSTKTGIARQSPRGWSRNPPPGTSLAQLRFFFEAGLTTLPAPEVESVIPPLDGGTSLVPSLGRPLGSPLLGGREYNWHIEIDFGCAFSSSPSARPSYD